METHKEVRTHGSKKDVQVVGGHRGWLMVDQDAWCLQLELPYRQPGRQRGQERTYALFKMLMVSPIRVISPVTRDSKRPPLRPDKDHDPIVNPSIIFLARNRAVGLFL